MNAAGDLHPARIAGRCASQRFGHTVVLFDAVESTNTAASALASLGAPEGTVVIALRQTAGRGRQGRRWISTPEGSLVFSIVARPGREPQSLTVLLALAAAEAIEPLVGGAAIKWPNDIWIGGRKCAGVLAETSGGSVVLGMGIDVNEGPDDLPDGLRRTAVSLRMLAGRTLDRGALLVDLLARLSSRYEAWERGGFDPMRPDAERLLLWMGEAVEVDAGGGRIDSGIVLGLTSQGYLRLGDGSGERIIAAGDAVRAPRPPWTSRPGGGSGERGAR
ncbi:MAG: biotin--[acetyl-CoA-carboxylase] ligase [Candidatus Krumholzibacteria bacterium]|nr:biotin--[acetyl-CoA-carboxylase] ligase [Candidatus Krumholzibacteria bacterium]